jgi:hypothetical protein
MNFALALAQNKVQGAKSQVSGTREQLESQLVPAGLSASTREVIENALKEKDAKPEVIAGLLLGSPEFQRR